MSAAVLLGVCCDFVFRDPKCVIHPVTVIAWFASRCRTLCRRLFSASAAGERIAGIVTVFLTCAVSYAVPAAVLFYAARISPILVYIAHAVWAFQIPAVRGLCAACLDVHRALAADPTLDSARNALACIVGRDTECLNRAGIIRATVETAAENTCDGIVAPLFFLCIGGIPLAMCYKAVNTMDSMFGYKNEEFYYFGWAAARFDDICGFIPARISALFMLLVSPFLHLNMVNGWRIFLRDRYCHASPNAGQTEAAAAGLLGIRLAGSAMYDGQLEEKPYIGDNTRPAEEHDILRIIQLVYAVSFVCLCLFVLIPVVLTAYV